MHNFFNPVEKIVMPETIATRSTLIIILLVSPIIAGWVANYFNIQPAGFVLLAIYPQVFLFFPASYMQSTAAGIFLSAIYWVFIFIISYVLVKKSLLFFLVTFLIISIGSIWSMHIFLDMMGYEMHVDSV